MDLTVNFTREFLKIPDMSTIANCIKK